MIADRETKSVSAEETFTTDIADRTRLGTELDLLATQVSGRLRAAGLSGRTITLKARYFDFTTITRSSTRAQPTDDPQVIAHTARRLLADVDTSGGLRLLGVGLGVGQRTGPRHRPLRRTPHRHRTGAHVRRRRPATPPCRTARLDQPD